MMYSNIDLKTVLESGDLVVTPCKDAQIKPAGLTMLLGKTLLIPQAGTIVDVKHKIIPDYKEVSLTEDSYYTIQPGEFLLAHTHEKVTVGDRLGFFLEGRSTLARVGLTVVQTAMLIYPGHKDRCITLELANHGPNPINLYYKMKIARSVVFELKTPTDHSYDDDGKYRKQKAVGVPIFDEEILD